MRSCGLSLLSLKSLALSVSLSLSACNYTDYTHTEILCNIVPPIITFDTVLNFGVQLTIESMLLELEDHLDPRIPGTSVLPMSKLYLQLRDPGEGMGGADNYEVA